MGSDYQSIYKQHIHENLLLRDRNKTLETRKYMKLKELNNAESKFRNRYKKYMDIARKPKPTEMTRQQSMPITEVSPRPHFIICKDLPYSFKTWGNLTDVTHEREGLDVYKTEVLDTDEKEVSYNDQCRRRSATVATSDLATRITQFRNKRNTCSKEYAQVDKLALRRRSKSFSNFLGREQIPGNVLNKSDSSDCVTSETMYQLPAFSSSMNNVSLAALLRCPERVSRSKIPSIILTTETGQNICLDDDRRASYNIETDKNRRLDLYIRRRKSVCVAQRSRNPTSSTEAMKAEVGLTRLLRTSNHLSASVDYIDKINVDADNRNYLQETFEDLKKCRYIRKYKSSDESEHFGELPTVQSLIMPPIQQRPKKIRPV